MFVEQRNEESDEHPVQGDRGRCRAGPPSPDWGAGGKTPAKGGWDQGARQCSAGREGLAGGTILSSQKQGAPMGHEGKKIPEEGKVSWALEPTWVQILTLLLMSCVTSSQ